MRRALVAAVRRGQSMRHVARRFHVTLATVQRWVARAGDRRLDAVNWADASSRPNSIQRTARALEQHVLILRRELKEQSALGEYGAPAIVRALRDAGTMPPSVRTVGRILARGGALDGRRRVRRPAPPPGWYLPAVAARAAELDSFDVVEGLVIKNGPHIEVLNGVALHSGVVMSCPTTQVTAHSTVEALIHHWRACGLPEYAQFDNDTRFQGPHQHRDVISRVMRLCLSLGVTPVFTPVLEHGFQAAIEAYNGRWQSKVWARFHHASLPDLARRSEAYVLAHRQRTAGRHDQAPDRRPFPRGWTLDLQHPPSGRLIYLRRTSEQGRVTVQGYSFAVDPTWTHRLVRCEFDLTAGVLRIYALRRRDPTAQPLLNEHPHSFPKRPFKE